MPKSNEEDFQFPPLELPDEEGLEYLEELFVELFAPGKSGALETLYISSEEIKAALLVHYPCKELTTKIMVQWLRDGDYKSIDMGGNTEIKLCWLVKKNILNP